MLRILLASSKARRRYDAGKHDRVDVEVRAVVRLGRILRDYREAGSVNSLLALWGFVDDTTFLTKAGDVGVVYRAARRRLRRPDACRSGRRSCIASRRRSGCSTSPAASTSTCSSGRSTRSSPRRAQQPVAQRGDPAPGGVPERPTRTTCSSSTLYLVLLYEAPHVVRRSTELRRSVAGARARRSAPGCRRDHTLAAARSGAGSSHRRRCTRRRRRSRCSSATSASRGCAKAEAFRFFRELVNYDPAVVDAARLDVRHASRLLRRRTPPSSAIAIISMVGDRVVKVLTMKEPPSQTFAHLLQDLYAIPGEFIACLEWQRIPSDRMRRDLQSAPPALLQQAGLARQLRRRRRRGRRRCSSTTRRAPPSGSSATR